MPDLDVIVKSLRRCSDMTICPNDCYYRKYACDCMERLHKDAIALLKEQNELLKQQAELLEDKEAKYGYWINPTSQDCHCSECGEQPDYEPGESVPLYDFCPYCGSKMEVKWND